MQFPPCCTGEERMGTGRPGARQIRAPEIVLGLDWGFVVDMWSVGEPQLTETFGNATEGSRR
eukprot:2731508-Amphidinium_carterae.2